MRLILLTAALVTSVTQAGSAQLEISTVVVPSFGKTVEVLAAVEDVVKEQAGVLPVRLEQPAKLADIVAKECPGATDSYIKSFASDVGRLNPELFKDPDDVTLDALVGSKTYDVTTVYIPFCLGSLSERYVVEKGDSLWEIYSQTKEKTGVVTWEEFLAETTRLNGDSVDKGGLSQGDVISLPVESWKFQVSTTQAKELVDKLNTIAPLSGKILMERPMEWGSADAARLDEADHESCTTKGELDALHGAESRLWDIAETLMRNDVLDERYGFRRNKALTRVAILDTGVDGPGHPVMERMVWQLGNRQDMLSYPDDPRSNHGTGVLFTAAGGYFLSTLNPLGTAVEAAPYNIHTSVCAQPQSCVYGADPSRLRTAMDLAFSRDSDISAVNISVSFTGGELEPWFKEFLGTDKEVLVVVSAGNDGLPIGDDNQIAPAIYGGDESSNLITVAGIDVSENLMPSSNHSKRKVDIAAWGCNVPVAEFDREKRTFVRQLRSGTSYAAPQVLFAAAMIARELPRNARQMRPSEVKLRLVTSADHNPALWDKIRHGRVLNFAKALSLHTDIVELKSTGKLLRGKVAIGSDDQRVARICGDQSPLRSSLLSIVNLEQAPDAGTQPILIYTRSTSVGGGLETSWCNAITSDVTLTDAFTKEEISVPASDIASIVFAAYEIEGN